MRAAQRTEPAITKELVELLNRVPGGYATKHSDQFTAGIADVSFCWDGPTTWLECKVLRPGKTLDSEIGEDQLVDMLKRDKGTHGRAWFLVWNLRQRGKPRTQLISPTIEKLRRDAQVEWAAPTLDVPGIDHESVIRFVLRSHRE